MRQAPVQASGRNKAQWAPPTNQADPVGFSGLPLGPIRRPALAPVSDWRKMCLPAREARSTKRRYRSARFSRIALVQQLSLACLNLLSELGINLRYGRAFLNPSRRHRALSHLPHSVAFSTGGEEEPLEAVAPFH